MTSSSDTFPFGIADVVELLGLTVRRRLPSSLYLNCPFCGDQRGRLNVNTDKNVWRCNRCGAAGGMLALYIVSIISSNPQGGIRHLGDCCYLAPVYRFRKILAAQGSGASQLTYKSFNGQA